MDRVCAKLKLPDHEALAPRILDGALADIRRRERVAVEESESNWAPELEQQAHKAMNMGALQK